MTTEFINDPIVPLQLKMAGGDRYTLYQPGWYTADDGSAGFLGSSGKLYGFRELDDLVSFVDSGASNDLTASAHLRTLRIWTAEEYSKRLCYYDLTRLPELADGQLDADEQASLGSTLALMLDLLDYMDVDTPDSQALHDDEDISKLASGDEVLAIFRAAHHRKHIVEILDAHWSGCLSEVSGRVTTPDIPGGADGKAARTPTAPAGSRASEAGAEGESDGDSGTPLEEVADAVTVWWGLAEEGVYTVRGTDLDAGHPRYAGTDAGGATQLTTWTDLDQMRTDLAGDPATGVDGLDLAEVLSAHEVSLTPHDDCIFDLVTLADSISPELDQESADKLVSAWSELLRLAAWGDWSDLSELLGPESPAGGFVVSCALDVAQDRPGAPRALASADTEAAAAGWRAVVDVLTTHLDIRS